MSGETNLETLLASMEPSLKDGIDVFATLGQGEPPPGLSLIGMFREEEGLTLILPKDDAARAGLPASGPMRLITLTVHSSLEAVGLTAAVATELARHGVSANVVAGYYHDHIFVPSADGERAMAALKALSESFR
jgi:hypothetical protein